jgi:hypothetical protein
MQPKQFFEELPAKADPERIAGIEHAFFFDIAGAGRWLVELHAGKLTVTEDADGDPEEQRERLAALAEREGLDDDRKRGREHDRAAEALKGPERDQPALRDAPLGREPAEQRGQGEDADPQRHHPPVPERVGQPSAVGEERSQGQQVGVDRPLDPGAREPELTLDVRRRDRDDRLVDEHHRHREDHRRKDEILGPADRRRHCCWF